MSRRCILLTQRMMESPVPPRVLTDFWTSHPRRSRNEKRALTPGPPLALTRLLSFLHQGAKSIECRTPLPRYLIQASLYVGQTIWAELPIEGRMPKCLGILHAIEIHRSHCTRDRTCGQRLTKPRRGANMVSGYHDKIGGT